MLQVAGKISHRLFVTLVLIAVIPICIMGYGTYSAAQKALTATAFQHLSTIAGDHANHLDAWFDERLHDIDVLSRLPAVAEVCKQHCDAQGFYSPLPEQVALLNYVIALTRGRSPSYASVHVLALSGELLASTDPQSQDLADFQNLPVLEQLRATDKPVLGPVHYHADQTRLMHLAAKVVDEHGQPTAYLLAILDLSKTLDPIMADRIGLGQTGETYLVDDNRRTITELRYLSRSDTAHRSVSTPGILAGLNHQQGTAIYTNYVGREVVGSYLWLPRYQWVVMAEMEKSEILAPIRAIKTVVLLTAGIVGGLCLLVALTASRQVSRPIIEVAQAAKEIAAGRLERRIAFIGTDEIGTLAGSFNTMAQQLATLIASLNQKEDSLQKACNDLVSAQRQLVQAEKVAAIGELTASVVHEMRNPLSSIKLNLQIIGRGLGDDTPLAEHYQIAVDQVVQLEKMFSDLLNYSKPLTIVPIPIDVHQLVERSTQQLAGELIRHNVAFLTKLQEQLPPIMGDADRIEQVIVNVLKNAIEAAGAGGRVELSTAAGPAGGKPMVIINIKDHGPGIPRQHLNRVFQPFFTTKRKGTGLGLAIVKKIMDAHQGTIFIASESGEGTTVNLSFPSLEV